MHKTVAFHPTLYSGLQVALGGSGGQGAPSHNRSHCTVETSGKCLWMSLAVSMALFIDEWISILYVWLRSRSLCPVKSACSWPRTHMWPYKLLMHWYTTLEVKPTDFRIPSLKFNENEIYLKKIAMPNLINYIFTCWSATVYLTQNFSYLLPGTAKLIFEYCLHLTCFGSTRVDT